LGICGSCRDLGIGLRRKLQNPSHDLFKMEAKVDIKPYQGEIDALKLNHWLQQLEVYFSIHHIDEEQKISFVD
jgi:hypothetical protein